MKKNILDKIVTETITEVLAEEQLDVTIKENKGQDEAVDLIQKLRSSTYPKLSDAELEAFGFEMFTHFKDYGEMKPNHMDLREAVNPEHKAFYDQVHKHVSELDRLLGANKPPKVPGEIWDKVYGLVGQIADKVDYLAMNENEMNIKTESIVKRLREDANYKEFFLKTLKMFGAKSPKDLSGNKKKEFFNYVDKNYKAKNESLIKEDAARADADRVQKELIKMARGLEGGHPNSFGWKIGPKQNELGKGFEVIEAEGPWSDLSTRGKTISGKTDKGETVDGKKTGYEAGELVVKLDPEHNIVVVQIDSDTLKKAGNSGSSWDKTANSILQFIQKEFPESQYQYNNRVEHGQVLMLLRKKQ